MKKAILVLFAGLIQLSGFSQYDFKTVKIAEDLELIKISDNAYIHVSYTNLPGYGLIGANGLIFINNNEAFLFDTPWTDALTEDLYSWLTDSMNLKITGFVPNHWHADCMGGLGFLQKHNVESYANQMTIDIAKSNDLPIPRNGFRDSLKLHLGEKLICFFYPGAAHSLDNIVVWIPSEQILFAGCMVKSINAKDLGNTVDGDLVAYPATIDNLIWMFHNAKIVIPGHGQPGGFELLKHTKDLATIQFEK